VPLLVDEAQGAEAERSFTAAEACFLEHTAPSTAGEVAFPSGEARRTVGTAAFPAGGPRFLAEKWRFTRDKLRFTGDKLRFTGAESCGTRGDASLANDARLFPSLTASVRTGEASRSDVTALRTR
jgi:hypothetical protein